MKQVEVQVLARNGNWAVVQLPGREFPGIHIQGDTFAALRMRLADVARSLRDAPGNVDGLDELDDAVQEIAAMLAFYEGVLSKWGLRRPY